MICLLKFQVLSQLNGDFFFVFSFLSTEGNSAGFCPKLSALSMPVNSANLYAAAIVIQTN